MLRNAPLIILLAVPTARAQTALDFQDATAARITQFAEAFGPHAKGVAVGDFDADGDDDVALAVAAGTFGSRRNKLYRNDGGTLVEISGSPVIPEFDQADVSRVAAFEDFDGDGWLDLLMVNDSFEFGDPIQLFLNRHPNGVFSHFEDEGVLRGLGYDWACGAVAEDLDGDGDQDVYTGNYGAAGGQDDLYLNDGNGFFTTVTGTQVPIEQHFTIDVSTGDVNGDGKLDLFISNDDAPYWIYYNDLAGSGVGDYQYGPAGNGGRASLGSSQGHGAIEPADFNGDGLIDLYWTNKDAPLGDVILVNQGNDANGRAIFVESDPPPYSRQAVSVKPAVGDIDGDGRPDVFLMTGSGRPAVLRNTSVNSVVSFVDWTPATAFPQGFQQTGASAGFIDVDGDGDLDLFLGGDTNDHLVENSPRAAIDKANLSLGQLPVFLDGAAIAVTGTVAPGSSDTFVVSTPVSGGFLSSVLTGAGDLILDVRLDGATEQTSDRGGDGVEEALQVDLGPGEWTVRVSSVTGGTYTLELMGRTDAGGSTIGDDCADALPIALGQTPFGNLGATTDGPPHAACFAFGDDQVQADVWFDYVSDANGQLVVNTCGTANFDTKIAVYRDGDCSLTDAELLGCSEDAVGCAGFTSWVSVPVECGESYKIRVGGYLGAQGTGTLNLVLTAIPSVSSYCTANANSAGFSAVMWTQGSTSVADNDLVLFTGDVPNSNGLFYYGTVPVLEPFGDGFRCVGGQVFRLPVVQATGTQMSYALDLTAPPQPAGQITAGSTWRFQAWYRDPAAGGAGFNTSDALELRFCP